MMFDRILASKPINATAARVTSRAEGWTPNSKPLKEGTQHWKSPPALAPHPQGVARSAFEDLTGTSFGRFMVIGWLGKFNKKAKGLWLVRCTCGDYEARTAKAIRNPANAHDRCYECQYFKRVTESRGNHLRRLSTPEGER